MAFSDPFLLLSIMFSGCVYFVACVGTLFPLMTKYYFIPRLYFILPIHSSDDGHQGSFPCGAIINEDAVNIHFYVAVLF